MARRRGSVPTLWAACMRHVLVSIARLRLNQLNLQVGGAKLPLAHVQRLIISRTVHHLCRRPSQETLGVIHIRSSV